MRVEQVYDAVSVGAGELAGAGRAAPQVRRPPVLGDDLLRAYVDTEVVDARGAVWSGRDALRGLQPCWVITAENPFSELRGAQENAAAMARLRDVVQRAGHATVDLVGRAADLTWSEQCLAVRGPSLHEVSAWGRVFDQHAVFRLTGARHEVVSCWSGSVVGGRERVLASRSASRR